MRSRLVVRADGGKRIGLGHWSRCLFLAGCFKSINSVSKVVLYTKNQHDFEEAFPNVDIEVRQLGEEEDFCSSLQRGEVVLLDGYDFTPDYFIKLKQKGVYLLYVDDLVKPGCKADIIINHSLGIKSNDYHSPALYSSFYLNSGFSLVPKLFKGNIPNKDKIERIGCLFLCMGGADPSNETTRLLDHYEANLRDFKKVYIVLGHQYQFEEDITKRWGATANFEILQGINKEQVSQIMQQCGIALLPASTMAVEYAHVGGILGIIQTANNQQRLHKGLLKEGVAVDLQEIFRSKDKIALYHQLIEKQCQTFDGLSKERFMKLFNELTMQQSIRLRVAKREDTSLTFQWAKDKNVRAYSFSNEDISWDRHQQWFKNKVEDENCLYYIAELDHFPVGSVRFDLKDKKAIISYLIDSNWHGKGLGRIILAEGIKHLQNSDTSFDELIGFVMEENTASIKIFERMGFERAERESQIKYFKKVLHD